MTKIISTWSETDVGGLFPNEVTDNISCNESDVDCLDTYFYNNCALISDCLLIKDLRVCK